jgi:Rrf2 family iron-sulfur cluster assembly transcriptional regulator
VRLSTKSRYGLRALFDMAYNAGNLPIQVKEISARQNISPRYLEQIFQSFKKAGILTKNPEDITVREVVEAAEGDTLLVNCSCKAETEEERCEFNGSCVTQEVWAEASNLLNEFFSCITLKTLCERGREVGLKRESSHKFMYYI